MVTVFKYMRYWTRVRKRDRTFFSARAQISLIFQDSYHVFCLSCNFNNWTYFFPVVLIARAEFTKGR